MVLVTRLYGPDIPARTWNIIPQIRGKIIYEKRNFSSFAEHRRDLPLGTLPAKFPTNYTAKTPRTQWGHSPQKLNRKREMRIHCGKFSIKRNHAEHQLFLLFMEYSEKTCGECPHMGLGKRAQIIHTHAIIRKERLDVLIDRRRLVRDHYRQSMLQNPTPADHENRRTSHVTSSGVGYCQFGNMIFRIIKPKCLEILCRHPRNRSVPIFWMGSRRRPARAEIGQRQQLC